MMQSGTNDPDGKETPGGGENFTTPLSSVAPTGDEVKSLIRGLMSQHSSPAAAVAQPPKGGAGGIDRDTRPSTVRARAGGPDKAAADQERFTEAALQARSHPNVPCRCGICNRAKKTNGSRCVVMNDDGTPCEFVVCDSHLTSFAGDVCRAGQCGMRVRDDKQKALFVCRLHMDEYMGAQEHGGTPVAKLQLPKGEGDDGDDSSDSEDLDKALRRADEERLTEVELQRIAAEDLGLAPPKGAEDGTVGGDGVDGEVDVTVSAGEKQHYIKVIKDMQARALAREHAEEAREVKRRAEFAQMQEMLKQVQLQAATAAKAAVSKRTTDDALDLEKAAQHSSDLEAWRRVEAGNRRQDREAVVAGIGHVGGGGPIRPHEVGGGGGRYNAPRGAGNGGDPPVDVDKKWTGVDLDAYTDAFSKLADRYERESVKGMSAQTQDALLTWVWDMYPVSAGSNDMVLDGGYGDDGHRLSFRMERRAVSPFKKWKTLLDVDTYLRAFRRWARTADCLSPGDIELVTNFKDRMEVTVMNILRKQGQTGTGVSGDEIFQAWNTTLYNLRQRYVRPDTDPGLGKGFETDVLSDSFLRQQRRLHEAEVEAARAREQRHDREMAALDKRVHSFGVKAAQVQNKGSRSQAGDGDSSSDSNNLVCDACGATGHSWRVHAGAGHKAAEFSKFVCQMRGCMAVADHWTADCPLLADPAKVVEKKRETKCLNAFVAGGGAVSALAMSA
jgi:hypothetical protein